MRTKELERTDNSLPLHNLFCYLLVKWHFYGEKKQTIMQNHCNQYGTQFLL